MAEYTTVTVAETVPPGKVVLWERDPRHPKGEVFIANPEEDAKDKTTTFQVGMTAMVAQCVQYGTLLLQDKPAAPKEK